MDLRRTEKKIREVNILILLFSCHCYFVEFALLNITRKVLKFKRDNQKPSIKGHNNTVVKRKRTKGQTMGHKTLHIHLKIE
jgi:hypothetical protein